MSRPPLSQWQTRVVEGAPQPLEARHSAVPVRVHGLGHLDLRDPEQSNRLHRWSPPTDLPEQFTSAGYCGVYTATLPDDASHTSTHYAKRWTNGGSSGHWCGSWDEAVATLEAEARGTVAFWLHYARLVDAGYTPEGERIIRADGQHYVTGREPGRAGRHQPGLGMSGSRMEFIMLANNEHVVSHNLWSQGRIPDDLRHLLPDNARRAVEYGPNETATGAAARRGAVVYTGRLTDPLTDAERAALPW